MRHMTKKNSRFFFQQSQTDELFLQISFVDFQTQQDNRIYTIGKRQARTLITS